MTPETFRTPGKRHRRDKGTGSIHQRADGQWVGRVELPRGPDGQRRRSRPVYAGSKSDLILKMQRLRDSIDSGTYTDRRDYTIASWLDYWLATIARGRLRPRTHDTYASTVRNQIVPHIGARKLADLTTADVRLMHDAILTDYSTRTCEAAHNILSVALDDAMREQPPAVSRNVAKMVRKPRVAGRKRVALTVEQAQTLLLSAYEARDPWVTLWAAALLTGARPAELLGLQWSRVGADTIDLSWQLQRLRVKPGADRASADRFDVPPGYEHVPLYRGTALVPVKTERSRRVIPLSTPLAAILRAHRATALPNEWDLVWVSEQYRPLRLVDVEQAWYDALARADLPEVELYATRHTAATLLQQLGVPEPTRMAILGHSSVAAQRIYAHVDLGAARDALGRLDVLLAPITDPPGLDK